MSSMYGDFEEMFARLTPEQRRDFAEQRLDRKRAVALGYTLSGIPSSPEHEAYDVIMSRMQNREMAASDSQRAPVRLLGDISDKRCPTDSCHPIRARIRAKRIATTTQETSSTSRPIYTIQRRDAWRR